VFDLCDPGNPDLTCGAVCHDTDYALPHQLAAEAHRRGAEGLLVWSCAVEPACSLTNLIIFANGLLPESSVAETGVWSQIRPL
jgi:hypothetical protein